MRKARGPLKADTSEAGGGWGHSRIAVDDAKILKDFADIHVPASLYEAFPAEEGRRPVERFEWHFTTADAQIKLEKIYPNI